MRRRCESGTNLEIVPNSSGPGSAVRTPVFRRAATTPVATLATEHFCHEFLEFLLLSDKGALEATFTASSTPPPNEQCSGEQSQLVGRSASDVDVSDRRHRVHVQIRDVAECQTAADVTASQNEGHRRVCALTPFGDESFARLK